MSSARDALFGFADKEAETRYARHLDTQIKPWFLQISFGFLAVCITLARAAGPFLSPWNVSVAQSLGAVFLCLLFYKNLQRLSGTFVVASVYAVYCSLRLIGILDVTWTPVVETILVGGERLRRGA